MDRTMLTRFRDTLTRHRDHLLTWLNGEAPAPVLDRCGVGRDGAGKCTPMDAVTALDEALDRIDHGAFGRCTLCDGEVEPERLELDFTTCVCLSHYTEAQIRHLERDLELAARVQQQLFPACVPALPGIQVAAHAHPAHLLSGDYYDFFAYENGVQGFGIADVMGKGLPASMLMANLQASLRILGPEYEDLGALMVRLNELFRHNLKLIRFISVCLLALDPRTRQLRYANAGHNPPLFWEAANRSVHWLKPTGPAIGLLHAPSFHTDTLALQPGDLVVLYTDGLVEMRSPAGEAFGDERLAHFVTHHHGEPAEAILRGLRSAALRFAGGRAQDDLALLVLKVEEA